MAKKKCKKCECPAGEAWAVPFADFLSLLLALFIALYALASVNKAKLAAVKAAFVKIYNFRPPPSPQASTKVSHKTGNSKKISKNGILMGSKGILNSGSSAIFKAQTPSNQMESNILKRAKAKIAKLLIQEKGTANIFLKNAQEGFIINLPASMLFNQGSAKITNEDTLLLLKRIVVIIKQLPKNVNILVNGYTDNTPPASWSTYKNNWQLSSARAVSVVQALQKDGVSGKRLAAVGYGKYNPIASNKTASGRAKNRRVTISFIVSKIQTNKHVTNILDKKSQTN